MREIIIIITIVISALANESRFTYNSFKEAIFGYAYVKNDAGFKSDASTLNTINTTVYSLSYLQFMDTTEASKSKWRCRMLLNADGPDPEWKVDEKTAKELLDYCEKAKPYEKVFDIPSSEGYSGVIFCDDKNSYTAYKGKIEFVTNGKRTEKADLGRSFEQMVLKTASPEFKNQAYQQLTIDFD